MIISVANLLPLIKLLLAHVITDFFLQTEKSVKAKRGSIPALIKHGLVTATVAAALFSIGNNNNSVLGDGSFWAVFFVILITHTVIDYRKVALEEQYTENHHKTWLFITDQLAHILVIIIIWLGYTGLADEFDNIAARWMNDGYLLVKITGYLLVTQPAAIFIREVMRNFKINGEDITPVSYENGFVRKETAVNNEDLMKAGYYIGILERIILLTLVLHQQYTAIGFLVAAKSILRISEKERNAKGKIEYIIIGTLLSFSIAMITGLAILWYNEQ